MSSSPLLRGKHAVVFGAAGSVGAAVAKEFAAQGAEVFLSGRHRSGVEKVTHEITTAGGRAHASVVDALDDAAVNDYIKEIVARAGSIDAVFNAMGPLVTEYANGQPAVDVSVEEFIVPVNTVLKSQFITARAAARQMLDQRRGVIIFLTGGPPGRTSQERQRSAPRSAPWKPSLVTWPWSSARLACEWCAFEPRVCRTRGRFKIRRTRWSERRT